MIRLLIVDDSVAFRMFLRKCLTALDEVEVVGVARDGLDALAKVKELKPDVITLDMNMPRMNGMETLVALKRDHPEVAVIIVAAETEDDADRTVQALNAGAFDFILKPKSSDTDPVAAIQRDLLPRLKELKPRARQQMPKAAVEIPTAAPATASALPPPPVKAAPDILAIGSSTGGPAALRAVLIKLPAGLPIPTVVVQHMPELFIRSLAQRLDHDVPLHCRVATDGETLRPGTVYFAPGNWHMHVVSEGGQLVAKLSDAEPVHFCKPAVDATFHSLAELSPRIHTLAVVLTGMGKDGAAGALALAQREGYVIAQDKATSTVWGMPGSTVNLGAAHNVLPLDDIAGAILGRVRRVMAA